MVLLKTSTSESLLGYSLEEQGLFVRFKPEQFIQVNSKMNEDLVRTALCFFGDLKNKLIDDYFCGIGNFSLPLAREGASVRGLELSEEAVGMASINARNNGLSHRTQFFVSDLYEKYTWAENNQNQSIRIAWNGFSIAKKYLKNIDDYFISCAMKNITIIG